MLEKEPAGTDPIAMSFYPRFISMGSRALRTGLLLWAGSVLVAVSHAAPSPGAEGGGTQVRIDASQPYVEPAPARYDEGSATSPSGETLGLNSRYLTRNGVPWLPVMGEFHFSRYPRVQWEEEILKMKAAGVDIVSTYVIWIHHEEIKGQFDWNGQRDLRAFAQLCAKHKMYLVVRIGPWDHGEVRNGGLPDWVLKDGPTRVNDPVYLASVRRWYGQIGHQLNGLMWKDDGPVIGIQLENEYAKRGPGAGEAHLLELKKIALASGLDAPLYFVTGWDNAVVPPEAVIPIYGGYPAAPWDNSLTKLPAPEVYAFRFQSRVAANANTGGVSGEPGTKPSSPDQLPYLTAEIGGGNEDTYHRRPVIAPDDVAAIFPVMLGSGVNGYGTYMFQGGENPDGKLTTLQESQETGYPNDLPIKSYDFQAPLGEFGREAESFHKLKVFEYFLNDFGAELAPMTVHAPETLPRDPSDLSVSRASVRSRGDSGFIFFNNYVRGYSMPARPAMQLFIKLPRGLLAVPRQPIDVPSGAYFIWPFNFKMASATLRYSTAQLFTRVMPNAEERGNTTFYFEAIPGIPAEFAFNAHGITSVRTSSGEAEKDSGVIYVTGIKPGVESSIDLESSDGKRLHLVVLTTQEAEDAWKVRIGGSDHLLITAQDFFADPRARTAQIWLRSENDQHFAFAITPPVTASLKATLPLKETTATGQVSSFAAEAPAWNAAWEWRPIQASGIAPQVKLGPTRDGHTPGVAEAPGPGDLPQAAKWVITVPAGAMDGLSELYMQVNYQGDVARFSRASQLLTDNFNNGHPWTIGLKRFLAPQGSSTFDLSVLPLRKDAPVYFEFQNTPDFAPNGQVDKLDSIRFIPEYQLGIDICDH
jgi:hypothetical protein